MIHRFFMAYLTSYRRSNRRSFRRTFRKKRYGSTLKKKRSTTRYTKYRKRPLMNRRSLLSVSTLKKSDSLLSGNVLPVSGFGAFGPITLTADNGQHVFCFSPTMKTANSGATPGLTTLRTATTTFVRGYAERLSFSMPSSAPWHWRRVCFTTYGENLWENTTTTGVSLPRASPSPTGDIRAWFDLGSIGSSNLDQDGIREAIYSLIFKGTLNQDYSNPATAPVDKTRCKIYSDTQMVFRSGNEDGTLKLMRRWYPINRNLIYGDVQRDQIIIPSLQSTEARTSLGDYVILDIFTPQNALADNALVISADGIYYWHEK